MFSSWLSGICLGQSPEMKKAERRQSLIRLQRLAGIRFLGPISFLKSLSSSHSCGASFVEGFEERACPIISNTHARMLKTSRTNDSQKDTLENCPKTSSPFVNKRTKSGQKRRGGIPSRPPPHGLRQNTIPFHSCFSQSRKRLCQKFFPPIIRLNHHHRSLNGVFLRCRRLDKSFLDFCETVWTGRPDMR